MRWFISKKKLKEVLQATIQNATEQRANADKVYIRAYCSGTIDICKSLMEELL